MRRVRQDLWKTSLRRQQMVLRMLKGPHRESALLLLPVTCLDLDLLSEKGPGLGLP